MLNELLVKLSLAVVITALNVSFALCQIGVVGVISREGSSEGEEITFSPIINGETEIAITRAGQVVLETVASKSAPIPLLLASGVYQIVATHRLTERREIRLLEVKE